MIGLIHKTWASCMALPVCQENLPRLSISRGFRSIQLTIGSLKGLMSDRWDYRQIT